MLENLPDNYRAVVFGATGGIGAALVDHLVADPRCGEVWTGARNGATRPDRSRNFAFDLEDEASLEAAAARIQRGGAVHLVIIATGMLHGTAIAPERSWRELDAANLSDIFAINTIGPALVAKHFLDLLPKNGTAIFAALSARVGSISDNRLGGWHSYRASKAALNMLVRNFAIELSRKNRDALCVGLHPGTVRTGLSEPFQRNVPAEKLFSPGFAATRLLAVLTNLEPEMTGRAVAWDGQLIES